MRLMPAWKVSQSPWMNPARWTAILPATVDATSGSRDHYATVLATGPERERVARAARHLVLAYRIFPRDVLEPAMPNMTVQPGDTIVQGLRFGPIGMIAAVRVTTVFDRERDGIRRVGFSYVTLEGHPARGGMTFAVVDDPAAGSLTFEMDAISQPGHWLTRLGRPFARRAQRRSSQTALEFFAGQARATAADDLDG